MKIVDIGVNSASGFVLLDGATNGANELASLESMSSSPDPEDKFGYTLVLFKLTVEEIQRILDDVQAIQGFILIRTHTYRVSGNTYSLRMTFLADNSQMERDTIKGVILYRHLLWNAKRKHIVLNVEDSLKDVPSPQDVLEKFRASFLTSEFFDTVLPKLGHVVQLKDSLNEGQGSAETILNLTLKQDQSIWSHDYKIETHSDILFLLGLNEVEIFELLNNYRRTSPTSLSYMEHQTDVLNHLNQALLQNVYSWDCDLFSRVYSVSQHTHEPESNHEHVWVLSLLTQKPTIRQLKSALKILKAYTMDILAIKNLSMELYSCLEVKFVVSPDTVPLLESIQRMLYDLSFDLECDLWLQVDSFSRSHKRLAAFDMDSTLVYEECIDVMAEIADVAPLVSTITENAMLGLLDFEEALKERVKALQGQSLVSLMGETSLRIHYSPGALFMCHALNTLQFETILVSGGFTPIVDKVRSDLCIRYGYGNYLETDPKTGLTTGLLEGDKPIVDGKAKKQRVEKLQKDSGLKRDLCMVIGDGANDRFMLETGTLDIAYKAKPILQKQAHFHMNVVDNLRCVLSTLGHTPLEAQDLVQ